MPIKVLEAFYKEKDSDVELVPSVSSEELEEIKAREDVEDSEILRT